MNARTYRAEGMHRNGTLTARFKANQGMNENNFKFALLMTKLCTLHSVDENSKAVHGCLLTFGKITLQEYHQQLAKNDCMKMMLRYITSKKHIKQCTTQIIFPGFTRI